MRILIAVTAFALLAGCSSMGMESSGGGTAAMSSSGYGHSPADRENVFHSWVQ